MLANGRNKDMLEGLIRLMASCLSFDKDARPSLDTLIEKLDDMLSVEDALNRAAAAAARLPASGAEHVYDTLTLNYF